MGTILAAAFRGLFGSIFGWLGSLLASQEIFRRGEESQHTADQALDLKDAERANEISAYSNSLGRNELNQRLREQQTDIKRMLLDKTNNPE